MPLNPDGIVLLEDILVRTMEGKNTLQAVPYFICVYNPREELDALNQFSNLVLRLRYRGFSAESISLSDLMLEILDEEGYLSEDIMKEEENSRDEFENDLRRFLLEGLTKRLKQMLHGKPIAHCAVLLRYGALWPFVHLSGILQEITGSIDCTLAIAYPSSIGEGYPLDEESSDTFDYYRAERVDLR